MRLHMHGFTTFFWTGLLLVVFHVFAPNALAAELSSALVRPSRTKISVSPLPVLVQAKVGETVTENGVQLTIGSGWTISGSASSFTVSTSGLPDGVSSWPGIGTATGLSGSQITFPGSDLTPGTTYGFYITGGITLNPSVAGSNSDYIWQLSTLVGGSPSSQSDVVVAIVANDQVTITAQILPPADAFSTELSTTSDISDVPQDTTLDYTVTYGSTHTSSSPVTLVASWSLGTIAGSGSANVELLEYVASSASNAYGSTVPVVDLANRTITWTISSLPANTTGQTVTFSLKTTDNYTGSSLVTADVVSRISAPTTTPDSSSEMSYAYVSTSSSSSSSSGSSSSGASSTSTSTSANTTAAQAEATNIRFQSYSIEQLTDQLVQIGVLLNTPATLALDYGLNPKALTKRIVFPTRDTRHTVQLLDLLPNTTYFLRFTARDGTKVASSELLSFTTAVAGALPLPSELTLTSNGLHLLSTKFPNQTSLLVPINSDLEMIVRIDNDFFIEGAALSLGKSNTFFTTLARSQPGVWGARVSLPNNLGITDMQLRLTTTTGTVQTFSLGSLKISPPLTIYDAQTEKPIERARVFLSRFDERTRLFVPLASPEFLAQSPMLANTNGEVALLLPPGLYELTIHGLGYMEVHEQIDTRNLDAFPRILLTKSAFPFIDAIKYHIETVQLRFERLLVILKRESGSSATVGLFTLWALFITTPLTILGLLATAHFSPMLFIKVFRSRSDLILGKSSQKISFLHWTITDRETGKPIKHVVVQLISALGVVKAVTQSDRRGSLAFKVGQVGADDTLLCTAPGYTAESVQLSTIKQDTASNIQLSKQETRLMTKEMFLAVVRHMLINTLELNIVLSLALSLLFVFVYQNSAALPLLGLSTINTVLYAHSRLASFMHALHIKKM